MTHGDDTSSEGSESTPQAHLDIGLSSEDEQFFSSSQDGLRKGFGWTASEAFKQSEA